MCALIMELYKDNLELLNISHFHLFLKFDIDQSQFNYKTE